MTVKTGFKCECGKTHAFSSYVFAHWTVELTHDCKECGRRHIILRGNAIEIEKD